MADVGYLTTGILLEAQLDDPDFFMAERDLPLDAQDAGALEAGGNAAVQVLLAGDMELADDIGFEQQGHFHGDLQGPAVEQERRRVVDLVSAGGFIFDTV